MKINWFPGHMAKALRMMQEEVKNVSTIIYVLDSRAPFSCINPSFLKVIGNKPIVYVLNKCDMVNSDELKMWQKEIAKKDNCKVLVMNATESGASKKIELAIKDLMQERIDRYLEKGAKITLKAMILGVPNSGKSTLANNLNGKAKAITGDRAGVTKSKQWIKVGKYLEVLDTPGTLWPNLENNETALNLAFIGSIKEEVLDKNDLALALVDKLIKLDSESLTARYGEVIGETALETLDNIANVKAFKLKGGDIDYDRVCAFVLNDYKKGKLTTKILDKLECVKCF
ncbi:MAG: ribosome biogenesis GTPase YlqF [Clostridia bacterium]|nr:ribosome biogenesis GTPase YlqF [Clostridia bacterium]